VDYRNKVKPKFYIFWSQWDWFTDWFVVKIVFDNKSVSIYIAIENCKLSNQFNNNSPTLFKIKVSQVCFHILEEKERLTTENVAPKRKSF